MTVTDVPKQPMTVWYKPASSWKTAKVHYKANGKWTGSAQQMTLYRNGWYKYTIPDTAGGQVRMAFTDGGSAWDNNGKDYFASGSVVSVSGGKMSSKAPSFGTPMTVWYKPASSWKTAKVHYKANGKWTGSAQQMTAACGGWYKYTIRTPPAGRCAWRSRMVPRGTTIPARTTWCLATVPLWPEGSPFRTSHQTAP